MLAISRLISVRSNSNSNSNRSLEASRTAAFIQTPTVTTSDSV